MVLGRGKSVQERVRTQDAVDTTGDLHYDRMKEIML